MAFLLLYSPTYPGRLSPFTDSLRMTRPARRVTRIVKPRETDSVACLLSPVGLLKNRY